MCDFLEKMESDSIQTPGALRQTLAAIGNKITNLETLEFDNLKIANEFNNKRKDISVDITSLNENLSRLNASELESACKETISNAPNHFKQLMDQTGQTDKSRRYFRQFLSGGSRKSFPGRAGTYQWRKACYYQCKTAPSGDSGWGGYRELFRKCNRRHSRGSPVCIIRLYLYPGRDYLHSSGITFFREPAIGNNRVCPLLWGES